MFVIALSHVGDSCPSHSGLLLLRGRLMYNGDNSLPGVAYCILGNGSLHHLEMVEHFRATAAHVSPGVPYDVDESVNCQLSRGEQYDPRCVGRGEYVVHGSMLDYCFSRQRGGDTAAIAIVTKYHVKSVNAERSAVRLHCVLA